MKFTPLSKDQIKTGIIAPFIRLLAFAFSFITDKTILNEIVEETKEAIDGLKTEMETPPNVEEAVGSVLKIADTLADSTETKADDTAVEIGQLASDFIFKRGAGIVTFFKLIGARIKQKKAEREESREDKEL